MNDYAKGLETASLMVDERIHELVTWTENAGFIFQAQLEFAIHELTRLAGDIAEVMDECKAEMAKGEAGAAG